MWWGSEQHATKNKSRKNTHYFEEEPSRGKSTPCILIFIVSVSILGSGEDLYRKPDTLFVSSFIGSPPVNHLAGRVVNGAISNGSSQLHVSGFEDGNATLAIRPEDLRPVRDGSAGIPGTINHIEPMGREVLVGIETGFGHVRMLQAGSTAKHSIGDRITVTCKQANAIVFDAQGARRDKASVKFQQAVS